VAAPGFADYGGNWLATFKAGAEPPHPSPQMNAPLGGWGQILNIGAPALPGLHMGPPLLLLIVVWYVHIYYKIS